MTRLQDDFYHASMGSGLRQQSFPMINLDRRLSGLRIGYRRLHVGITGQWQRGENVPDDGILQNFVKYHRMVRTLTHVRQLVSRQLYPGSMKSRLCRHLQSLPQVGDL